MTSTNRIEYKRELTPELDIEKIYDQNIHSIL